MTDRQTDTRDVSEENNTQRFAQRSWRALVADDVVMSCTTAYKRLLDSDNDYGPVLLYSVQHYAKSGSVLTAQKMSCKAGCVGTSSLFAFPFSDVEAQLC